MPTTANFTYVTLSLQCSEGEYGEDSTITERRHVVRNNGSPFDPFNDSKLCESEGVIPRRGDIALAAGTGTWEQFCRFRGYTWELLPNGRGCIYTLTWSTRYSMTLSGSPVVVYYALKSSVTFQSQSRSSKVYRTGWTVNPPAASNASADIGGTAVQGIGEAMAFSVNQNRIRVAFEQDALVRSISTSASILSSYMNTTNSATFLNCAANTLVCEGVTFNQIKHEFYEVVFDFLYDDWYHHEQVPDVAVDGRPVRTSNNVAVVKWKRLPRPSADFNLIYGGVTQLKTITETGYPAP